MIDDIEEEEPELSRAGAILTQVIAAVVVLSLTIIARSLSGAG